MDKRNIYLTLIATSHGINHIYQLLTPIIIPKIADEYLLSTTSAAVLISMYSLSYALLQAPSGILSKTLGRKNTIILGFVITFTSFLIMGFIDNLILFALLLFLAGVGGSTYHPNGMPLLSGFFKENRGQAAGFHQTGGSLGSVIAPLVIGPLVIVFGWRLTLSLLAFPGLILSIALWLVLKEPKQIVLESSDKLKTKPEKTSVKRYGPSLIFIAATVTYTLGIRGVDALAVLYFQRGRGISNYIEATFIFSTLKIAGLFSAPICGRLSDTFGRKKAIAVLVCIEAACLYLLTVVPNNLLVGPCLFFGFASFGLLAITDAFLADITPKRYMETIFGLHFTLSFFTQVIIPPIFGAIGEYTNSFDLSFIILSLIVPLSIPILLKVKSQKRIGE